MAQLMRQSSLLEKPVVGSAPASAKAKRQLPPWMRSNKTKVILSVAMLVIAAIVMVFSMSGQEMITDGKTRLAIDSETSQVYKIRLVDGETFPWKNPDTGKNSLYPVEKCYWTRDGKAKLEPTFVFVKSYAGIKEKTTCPDCGREVRPHNPLPPDELMSEAAEKKNAR